MVIKMKEIRCYGCGAVLQHDDPRQPGYVPSQVDRQRPLCQRCFKIMHYHKMEKTSLTKDDFLKIIDAIGSKKCLVVYIVDLFDFNGSEIPGLMRHIGYNDVLVLANKRDLLPASLKEHKLEMWLRRQLKQAGIKPVDVVVTSSKKNMNFDLIFDLIESHRRGHDVYVVGVTNVGKSTFINGLIRHYSDLDHEITTSEFPGTTLDVIQIPLDDKSSLYDTPGVLNDHQMTGIVDEKILKKIMPRSEIKPASFQLNSDQTLYFDGLARMDYVDGERAGFTCYFSRELLIHRTKTVNADSLYNRHQQLKLTVPGIETIDQMKSYEFNLKGEKKEIVISGLGFINTRVKGKVIIKVPEGIDVIIREPMIG